MLISSELIVSRCIAESITTDAGRFGHVGLCQLRTKLRAVDKGLRGRNVLHHLLLILLCTYLLTISSLSIYVRTYVAECQKTLIVHSAGYSRVLSCLIQQAFQIVRRLQNSFSMQDQFEHALSEYADTVCLIRLNGACYTEREGDGEHVRRLKVSHN